MLAWHRRFSRFQPDSELCALNRDARAVVPVSAMMARFVQAACDAAQWTGGLVDPTLVGELERLGYRRPFGGLGALPLRRALALAPARRPASAAPDAGWRSVTADVRGRTVSRPPEVRLDSGGIAKGLFGDVLAEVLAGHASFAVDACGDLRFGGLGRVPRLVHVASPFDASTVHSFMLTHGAVATSGIGRRAWLDGDARPAHHLLDPATGRPAFTGVVQATALAPSGLEAEARAKAAVLAGAAAATGWLPHGGVVVFDDGTAAAVSASPALCPSPPAAAAAV